MAGITLPEGWVVLEPDHVEALIHVVKFYKALTQHDPNPVETETCKKDWTVDYCDELLIVLSGVKLDEESPADE